MYGSTFYSDQIKSKSNFTTHVSNPNQIQIQFHYSCFKYNSDPNPVSLLMFQIQFKSKSDITTHVSNTNQVQMQYHYSCFKYKSDPNPNLNPCDIDWIYNFDVKCCIFYLQLTSCTVFLLPFDCLTLAETGGFQLQRLMLYLSVCIFCLFCNNLTCVL